MPEMLQVFDADRAATLQKMSPTNLSEQKQMIFTPAEPQLLIEEHLKQHDNALLFVGMGLGKSAGCLHTLSSLFLSLEARAALVVAPMRVSNLTWPMEVEQWDQFRWMKVANLRTESGQRAFLNGSAHIYTINYESLKLLVELVERRGGELPYDVVIFDELTRAKNPGSKRINLYRRKVPRVKRQWGLTGTPMPNSWMDLFAQVRLIDGGTRLGTHSLDFKKQYFFAPEIPQKPWEMKHGTEATLEGKIADITLALKSSDYLGIPDVHFEDIDIPFCADLRAKYVRLEKELVIKLRRDKEINVTNAAALVTKLLQFTSGHMYDDDKDVHPIHNLKFDALRRVAKAERSPLLVSYQFKHEEARIREQFPDARFFSDCKRGRAEQTIAEEEKLIKAWNAGKVRMLAAHPASVGHGLNLQYGANALFWLTPTYNREHFEQMIARLARRGQTNITKVYRPLVSGTVDDAVVESVENKAENEARLFSALRMLNSFKGET